jgi:glycosyltransferase involved in cell wall biosynthesis
VKTLTVLVPFFNEERTIIDSLRELDKISISDEIILIDDGSTDSSFKLVQNFIKDKKKYKTIQSTFNKGKGDALNQSRGHITSEYVVIHDADLEYSPTDLIEMYKVVEKDKLVLGSRFIGTKKRNNIYLRTFLANKIMSFFFSVVHNKKITDVATCYKMMPSNYFKNNNYTEKGFSIEIEIMSKFLKHSKNIKEVPISYNGRSYEEGKKIKTTDGFQYLYNTIKYRLFE